MTLKNLVKKATDSLDSLVKETKITEKAEKLLEKGKQELKEIYEDKGLKDKIDKTKMKAKKVVNTTKKIYNSLPVQTAVGAVKGAAGTVADKISNAAKNQYDKAHTRLEKSASEGDTTAIEMLETEEQLMKGYTKAKDYFSIIKKSFSTEKYTALIPGYDEVIKIVKNESFDDNITKKYTRNLDGETLLAFTKEIDPWNKIILSTKRESGELETLFSLTLRGNYNKSDVDKVLKKVAEDAYNIVNDKNIPKMSNYSSSHDLNIGILSGDAKYKANAQFNDNVLEITYSAESKDAPEIHITNTVRR